MIYTLAQLTERVRQLSDTEYSDHIGASEITSYINSSCREFHDILISKFQDTYFLKEHEITLIPGTDEYSLPTDFYKSLGVDIQYNNDKWMELKSFQFSERNDEDYNIALNYYPYSNIRYKIIGSADGSNKIRFIPSTSIPGTKVKVSYAPMFPTLVQQTDTMNGYNGWEEYIIVDAAIKILIKQERSITGLKLMKAELLARIEAAACDADAAYGARVLDVTSPKFRRFGRYY